MFFFLFVDDDGSLYTYWIEELYKYILSDGVLLYNIKYDKSFLHCLFVIHCMQCIAPRIIGAKWWRSSTISTHISLSLCVGKMKKWILLIPIRIHFTIWIWNETIFLPALYLYLWIWICRYVFFSLSHSRFLFDCRRMCMGVFRSKCRMNCRFCKINYNLIKLMKQFVKSISCDYVIAFLPLVLPRVHAVLWTTPQ